MRGSLRRGIAGLLCSDHAQPPHEIPDTPVQPITGRPSLIAEIQFGIASGQFADQPLYNRRRTCHIAQKADLAATPTVRDRHRMLCLRRVEGNKRFAMLPHGPPSVHEARLAPPEQPSLLYCTKSRAAGL